MVHRRHPRRRGSGPRGTVYIPVLGTSLLVTVIGLGALGIARTNARIAREEARMVEARETARGGLEVAIAELAATDAWRAGSEGEWRGDVDTGAGRYTVSLSDPEDGDLGDDPADPVRVEVVATRGPARQAIAASVLVRDHVDVLGAQLFAGGAIGITDSTIAGTGVLRANAGVSASGSTVAPDVVAGTTISGGGFDGLATAGAAPAAVPDVSALATAWRAGAGTIDRSMLSPESADQLGNGSFEDGVGAWTASDVQTELGVDATAATHGARSMLVWGRLSETSGARLDITELVQSGIVPRITARVRPEPISASTSFELWLAWEQDGVRTVDAGPSVKVSDEWGELSVTGTFAVPAKVESATLMIVSPGSTTTHRIDDVRVMDADAIETDLVMQRVTLGPDHNPLGTPSPTGRYVLDAGGRNVVIRDCRIVGTVVVVNPGPSSRIEGSVAWRPVTPGDPILIVDGATFRLATDRAPLCETTLGVNLDPAAMPELVPGQPGSTALSAVVPSRLEGVVLTAGTVVVAGRPHLAGSLICSGSIALTQAELTVRPGEVRTDRVPAGFVADRTEASIVPESLRRVVAVP